MRNLYVLILHPTQITKADTSTVPSTSAALQVSCDSEDSDETDAEAEITVNPDSSTRKSHNGMY